MTPHQHTQLKQWATDLKPKPGEGHLYDLLHEAIDAVVPTPASAERSGWVSIAKTPIITNLTIGDKHSIETPDFTCELREPTHAEAYAALNPKVGERFKVVRRVEPEGWKVGWYHAMDNLLDATEIADICNPRAGVYLLDYWFPANALERVEHATDR